MNGIHLRLFRAERLTGQRLGFCNGDSAIDLLQRGNIGQCHTDSDGRIAAFFLRVIPDHFPS